MTGYLGDVAGPETERSPEPFVYRHRVTYAECTVGNHVYHSRYLDILEAARGEFLRAAGFPLIQLQEAGVIFPVIEARLKYHRPARYDDRLVIELRLLQAGGVRLAVGHRMMREDGVLLVEAETMHVCTRLDDKPQRIPKELLEALLPWRVVAV